GRIDPEDRPRARYRIADERGIGQVAAPDVGALAGPRVQPGRVTGQQPRADARLQQQPDHARTDVPGRSGDDDAHRLPLVPVSFPGTLRSDAARSWPRSPWNSVILARGRGDRHCRKPYWQPSDGRAGSEDRRGWPA